MNPISMYNLFFLQMHVSEPLATKYIYIDERGRRVRRGMTMLSQRRETREELATRLLDFFIGVWDGLGSLTAARHSGFSSYLDSPGNVKKNICSFFFLFFWGGVWEFS